MGVQVVPVHVVIELAVSLARRATVFLPSTCVALLTVVVVYPVPWHTEHGRLEWSRRVCSPVLGIGVVVVP